MDRTGWGSGEPLLFIQEFGIQKEKMMKEEDRKRIEEVMAGMKCPKDFKCAHSGFEQLCRAQDFGLEEYLNCLEDNPSTCSFALSFGDGHLCQCPLRVYLSKKLKK